MGETSEIARTGEAANEELELRKLETEAENEITSLEYLQRLETDGFARGVDDTPFREGEEDGGAQALFELGREVKILLQGDNPQEAILARIPVIDVNSIPERKRVEARLALGFLIQAYVWSKAARFIADNFGKDAQDVVEHFAVLRPEKDCKKLFDEAEVTILEPKVA